MSVFHAYPKEILNMCSLFFLGFHPKTVKRREIDKISLPESFEKIEEVNKGSDALRDNDIVILVGIKGSGKSTIGKAIIKQFCENTDYDMIQLSTTTNLDCCDDLGFFSPICSRGKVLVFLDDLFGRVPSIYALKEHIMLLKWVHERKDVFEIKILSTVQAETKACVEELFASDTLLKSAELINLHSAIYPRRYMLIKSGFDEERSDNIIRQMRETGEQERIGFPALLSILGKNQELGDELFINPGNVCMKYLSSLKDGSDQDKMYFVILIHVLMTGRVNEKPNTSDKESMCYIATTIFGNTLEFQKYDSSIESIIDEKEDGILMNINDTLYPYYCFKDEIAPDVIFQYYKEEAFKKDYTKEEFEKVLTTCSLNCIVSYFRPLTDTPDELFVYIDSSLYQSIASHIIYIIQKDLKTSRVSEVIMSVKTLCMSPLLQDENFLKELLMACDQLEYPEISPYDNFKLGFDKKGSLKAFHFPSLLLHQSCRQLSLMKEENVEVVKMIFQKVCDSRAEKVEICQTINWLVKFSMEELCKENIDKNVVLELLWKFIMDKKVDSENNEFLMNAWRYQCSKTVTWLQENVRDLQMEQCFVKIFLFIGVHKTSWILEHNPTSRQNRISMYKVFHEVLKFGKRPLMEDIWQLEVRILEDYKHDEQLQAIESTANVKKMFANKVIKIALKEVCLTSIPFKWACDTFKPHQLYFDKTTIKNIERAKQQK